MKALGKRTIEQKIALETDRYMQENYSELAYHAVSGAVPFIVKQTEAVMRIVTAWIRGETPERFS